MTAYMIILAEISDPENFRAYAMEAARLVEQFGGTYLARGTGESECLEGDWPDDTRLVISEWPSLDHARAFWNSAEYDSIKKLRHGKATVRVRLIDGVETI